MQPEDKGLSNATSPSPSNARGDWPPNIVRLLIAALVTAGLGYVVLMTLYPIFVVPESISNFPEQSPRWMYERLDKTKSEVDAKNFGVVFGVVGAIMGASCVLLAFGTRAVKALVIAVVLGAALGVVGANLSNWLFFNLRETSGKELRIMGIALDSMKQTILGYSLLWGPIGLGVGVGIGAVRSIGKSITAGISGLCGGVLGAMMYVILTAQFSVGTLMNRVIPYENTKQALWLVLFTCAISVCIALGTGEKKPAKDVA